MLATRTERLGRWTIIVVLVAAVSAVVGGIVEAAIWHPGREQKDLAGDPCVNPPCFGGGNEPLTLAQMPVVLPMVLLGAAALLGALTLLVTLATPKTRNRRDLILAILTALGPLVIFIGAEILPHLLSPCVPANLWGAEPPGICEQTPYGWELPGQWHLLDHALVGFLPLSLLVAWRWQVSAGRRPTAEQHGASTSL